MHLKKSQLSNKGKKTKDSVEDEFLKMTYWHWKKFRKTFALSVGWGKHGIFEIETNTLENKRLRRKCNRIVFLKDMYSKEFRIRIKNNKI